MTSQPSDTVGIAFDLLLNELAKEIRANAESGLRALQVADVEMADGAVERANTIERFRERVKTMAQEWDSIARWESPPLRQGFMETHMAVTSRRGLEGPRTPREAFYPLILTVLETMGGRGEVHTVLNGVHDLIAHRLTEADCEPLESDPLMTRWYKSANWARFEMVRQGLLKRDSPRGVWEITEAGRAYLREHAPDYPARE